MASVMAEHARRDQRRYELPARPCLEHDPSGPRRIANAVCPDVRALEDLIAVFETGGLALMRAGQKAGTAAGVEIQPKGHVEAIGFDGLGPRLRRDHSCGIQEDAH
jgi:hypothetical protein